MPRIPRRRARTLTSALLFATAAALAVPAAGHAQDDDPLLREKAPDCRMGPTDASETPCAAKVQVLPRRAANYRGLVLVVAGGSWTSSPNFDTPTLNLSDPWVEAGWKTLTIQHTSAVAGDAERNGARALKDVIAWAKVERARLTRERSANVPLCIYGQSSSGNLALLTTPQQGVDVACTVTEGAPTWLNQLDPDSKAGVAAARAFPTATDRWVYSPERYESAYQGLDILMGHMRTDRIVPLAQMTGFAPDYGSVKQIDLYAGRRCDADEIDKRYLALRFAHLCQQDLGGDPFFLKADELARWRTALRRMADRVGVGPLEQ